MVRLLFIWWQANGEPDVYELYMNEELVLKGDNEDYVFAQEQGYKKALDDVCIGYSYKREIRHIITNKTISQNNYNSVKHYEIKQEDSLVKKHEEARKKEE